MRKTYYIIISILVAMVIFSVPQELSAKKRKKKGDKTETQASPKKKTEYEKFLAKKGLKTYEGFLKAYTIGDEIWLEIPDSLIGRNLIRSSILEKSASMELRTGIEVSSNAIYQIGKTDSLILFQSPLADFVFQGDNQGLKEALELSKAQETHYALPIKYRNADSTACLVKVNSLFDFSKKEVVNLAGQDYGNLKIEKGIYKKELSRTIELVTFANTFGVRTEVTYELSLYIPGFGFQASTKPTLTTEILSSLTLMPEKTVKKREVDYRVGVRKIKVNEYSSSVGIKTKEIASRWDLANKENITIYLDTLLGETWMSAVKKGLEAWNPAFEKIGFNNIIKVKPFPSNDSTFRVDNPLLSFVTFAGGSSTNVSANILTNSSTGEIMSVKMYIPGDFVTGVRRISVYTISDVDTRYQNYFIPDDAVCEALTATVMSLFGRCLGLDTNLAGSAAFSPQQLKDVAFTQENGITASVTDDVLFNIYAKPGDKENGLVTIIDRIGPYDYYAIEWLYGHEGENTKEELQKLVDLHRNDPKYFYAPNVTGQVSDPRIARGALGNDLFENHKAGISHLKFVAKNADKWLQDENIPQTTYKDLFIDWLWLGLRTRVTQLSSYIGGMYANYTSEEGNVKFTAVPKDVQKKALKVIFETISDVSWMDTNKALIQMPGANKDVTRFTNANLFIIYDFASRLMHVAMAVKEADSDYSIEEYMDDVENHVFKDIKSGEIIPAGDLIVENYLSILRALSPVMTQKYKDYKEGEAKSISDFRILVGGVPTAYIENLDIFAFQYMQRANKLLKQGRMSAKNEHNRKKIEYLISITETVIRN